MKITWADRIKALEAQNWSLTKIGREIGLAPQSVSDIKNGRTKDPTGMAAVRLHWLHWLHTAGSKSADIFSPPSASDATQPQMPSEGMA